jgi:hypothetical protein
MLTLERAIRGLLALPTVVRLGLLLLVIGGFDDLTAHLTASMADHAHGFTPEELWAHLLVLVAMVVILLGVVAHGVRRGRIDPPVDGMSFGGR